jgi:hypothetical protein
VPKDPFESLSRGQRTMMGFAALKDAGFALQGKEGTAVRSVMKDITERADMERKRTAALAQNQLIQSALGGAGPTSGAGQPQTAEEYRQAATALARQIATMGAAGQSMIPMLQNLQAEGERLAKIEQSETSRVIKTGESINTVEDLIKTVNDEEGVTGFWGMMLSKVPWSKAHEVRVDADTLRSNMALGALITLKSQGGTLGAVSEKELVLLESQIAQLDFNQSKGAVMKDLEKIQNQYKRVIRTAYRDTNRPEELDNIMTDLFGQVPAWVGGNVQEYNFDNVPVGNMVFDAEDGKYYKFLGGDKGDENSWEEIM